MSTIWDRWLEHLNVWLVECATHPDCQQGLLSLLRAWKDDIPWTLTPTAYPAMAYLFACQQQAGTHAVIDGFLHPQWAAVQHDYYLWLHRRTAGF